MELFSNTTLCSTIFQGSFETWGQNSIIIKWYPLFTGYRLVSIIMMKSIWSRNIILYFVVPGLFFEDDFINFMTGFGIKTFQKVDSPHTRNFPCTQKEANNRSGPLRTQLVVANQFFRHPISSDFDWNAWNAIISG